MGNLHGVLYDFFNSASSDTSGELTNFDAIEGIVEDIYLKHREACDSVIQNEKLREELLKTQLEVEKIRLDYYKAKMK